MTLEEAAEMLDLKPSTSYRREELEEAVRKTEMRAQNGFRFASSPQAQEEAANRLVALQKAASILRSAAAGGTLTVPAYARRKPTRTRKRARKMTAAGTSATRPALARLFSRAKRGISSAPRLVGNQNVPKRLALLAKDASYLLLLLLTWPVRLLVQKQYRSAAATTVLTITVLWLSYAFVTVGVAGITARVKGACEALHRVLLKNFAQGRAGSGRDDSRGPTLHVEPSLDVEVWLDGRRLRTHRSSAASRMESGVHEIEIRRAGRRLYSTRLNVPRDARAKIAFVERGRDPHVMLAIEIPLVNTRSASHEHSPDPAAFSGVSAPLFAGRGRLLPARAPVELRLPGEASLISEPYWKGGR